MKIVLIGCSGHYYSALEAFEARKDLEFTGFARGVGEENCDGFIKNFKDKFGFKVYDSYTEMLERVKPDAAVVNSHFCANAGIASRVLEKNINCYVEKPMATTLSDLDALMKSYETHKASLAAMLEYRSHPDFRAAHDAIREGKIGDVLMVTAQKSYKLGQRDEFYKKRETYGGTIPWVGIHSIDWILWLSGKQIASVTAHQSTLFNAGHGDLETAALCLFEFKGGGFASNNMDYLRPSGAPTHGDDRVRVVGSKGIIEVKGEKAILTDDQGEKELPSAQTENLFMGFVNQVQGTGICPVSAEESFRATKIALIARQSADEKRTIYL